MPLLTCLASELFARAQSVVAIVAVPDAKVLRQMLGKNRSDARKERAHRLYQAAHRCLPAGTAPTHYLARLFRNALTLQSTADRT